MHIICTAPDRPAIAGSSSADSATTAMGARKTTRERADARRRVRGTWVVAMGEKMGEVCDWLERRVEWGMKRAGEEA